MSRPAPILPPAVARLVAFSALAVLAAVEWARLVAPAATGRLALAAAAAAVAAAAIAARRRVPGRARLAVVALCALVAVVVGALAVGVPSRLLLPPSGTLVDGLRQGASALPDAKIPYAGVDEWARLAVLCGGVLLLTAAALAVSVPGSDRRRRSGAFVLLVLLYAVPAVAVGAGGRGAIALFALLAGALVWLERVRIADAGPAALVVAGAVAGALAIAPALTPRHPVIDYQHIAASLAPRGGETFSWDHRYGPLSWPRDGHEVLRVRARHPAYWKATNLDDFDGRGWRATAVAGQASATSEAPRLVGPLRRWLDRVTVTVRGMRSRQVIGAGDTFAVLRAGQSMTPGDSPGTFMAHRTLHPGDSYVALVYAPEPGPTQLDRVRPPYPDFTTAYLTLTLPSARTAANPPSITFAPFGAGQPPVVVSGEGTGEEGSAVLQRSLYSGAYALARRLGAGTQTPYQYVRRVQSYLRHGFAYSETPPSRRVPLEAFLFRDRRGYCEQFSGAMALLLRMGGIPARVAAGFAPGTLDSNRHEYVVRDVDAHSWVEAYFPGYGWVTFDPTPSTAPARSQATFGGHRSPAVPDSRDVGAQGKPLAPRSQSDATGLVLLVLAIAAVLGLALAGAAWRRRRERRLPPDPVLGELRRALARTGRSLPPGETLARLERRFADSPEAAGYVRAVRAQRFAREATPPTAGQRRALRVRLAEGLGVGGRLRALWALPPSGPARFLH